MIDTEVADSLSWAAPSYHFGLIRDKVTGMAESAEWSAPDPPPIDARTIPGRQWNPTVTRPLVGLNKKEEFKMFQTTRTVRIIQLVLAITMSPAPGLATSVQVILDSGKIHGI